jgi:hypothetical protein
MTRRNYPSILNHWGTSLQHANKKRKMDDDGPIM